MNQVTIDRHQSYLVVDSPYEVAVPESVSRSAALNVLKAIPHYIVLMVYFVGAAVVALVGWFAVRFTAAWPQGMRGFLVQVSN